MEHTVKNEFERVLHRKAAEVIKTKHGTGNHNFFVTDGSGKKYVFKAFKMRGWPEDYKNRWISSALLAKGVRFPKVLVELGLFIMNTLICMILMKRMRI